MTDSRMTEDGKFKRLKVEDPVRGYASNGAGSGRRTDDSGQWAVGSGQKTEDGNCTRPTTQLRTLWVVEAWNDSSGAGREARAP